MLKNCSFESKLQKQLFLNFDEEGLVNVVFTGDPYMIMSLEQWVKVNTIINNTTREELLWDHFEAKEEESCQ